MFWDKAKYILPIAGTFILFGIISTNIKSIFNYHKGVERIAKSQEKLVQVEAENKELKENIEKAEQPEYIQKLAVEELNLTPESSTVLIIPEEKPVKKPENEESYSTIKTETNFDKWLVFLKLR